MQKVTVQSPANIAFIKYWGQTKHNLFIPRNNNISMTLSACQTVTTLERTTDKDEDTIEIKSMKGPFKLLEKNSEKGKKAYEQIQRIREKTGAKDHVTVKSVNTFPSDAGIASSASGFSALTGALLLAYDQRETFEDITEFSKEIRLSGSASAARSVPGGFVELNAGNSHDEAFAEIIADENHWDLVDIIAIINTEKKMISTSGGHAVADSSPYFETRITEMQKRIIQTREAIKEKNIEKLGPCIEADTISMHTVMMTSNPPIYYWEPGTISVMKAVLQMRKEKNLQAYFSIDAGANVHVICTKRDAKQVEELLQENTFVQETIYNEPCKGSHEVTKHLF